MTAQGGDRFAPHIEAVAGLLLGKPNVRFSKPGDVRYGSQGSMSIDVAKGAFFDHEAKEGGGVIDMIRRLTGAKTEAEAAQWMEDKGILVSEGRPERQSNQHKTEEKKVETAVYDYRDQEGHLVCQTVRFEFQRTDGSWVTDPKTGKRKKTFLQRRPDPDRAGAWIWNLKNIDVVPYRLAELQEAIESRALVFYVEGEKAAERLAVLRVPVTTNPMGAGKWFDGLETFFEGADVVILPDNDEPGQKHRDLVASHLVPVAKRVRFLELPGLGPKEDVCEWLDAGGTFQKLYELAQTHALACQKDTSFKPQLYSIPWDRLDEVGAESEWLVYQVITAGQVSMIVGPSQHGKSFFAVELGMAVARGVEFFGHHSEQGGVLYIAAESGRGLKKRLRAYRTWHDLKAKDPLPFVLLPGKFNLYASDDDTDKLIADGVGWHQMFMEQFGIPLRLVVIDTFAAATPGADEISARDVTPVLARAQRICEELDVAVSIVHHANAGGVKPRGHTSIFANVENVVMVEMSEKRTDEDGRPMRYAKVAKQKDSEAGKTWPFVLKSVDVGMDVRGKVITSCVCVPPKEDLDSSKVTDAGFEGSEKDRQLLSCVLEALRDQGQIPPQDVNCPNRISRVVSLGTVKKLYWRQYAGGEDGSEDQKKNALRQRWKRAHDRLVQYGIIGSDDPWLWVTGKPVRGMNVAHASVSMLPETEFTRLSDEDLDTFTI